MRICVIAILALISRISALPGQATDAKSDQKKPDAAGQPSLSLPKSDFKVDSGLQEKNFAILLQARNLSAELMKSPLSAADLSLPGRSKAIFEVGVPNIVELTPGKDSRDWWIPVTAKGIERNTNESHVLRVTVGSLKKDLDYTFSNQPTSDFKWTIQTPPNPWVIFGDASPLSIPISTGAQPITNVVVSHNLVEENTKRVLPADALRLCSEGNGCPIVRADANSVAHAYLTIKGDLPTGKYSGPVFFTTPEKAGPESVSFNINISSPLAYAIGVIVLILGVWLGWIVSVWTTARLARLTACKGL